MFVMLSKFLPALVYPVGLIFLLLLLALILRNRPRWGTALLASALAVLLIAGNSWVGAALVRSLENRYFPPQGDVRAEAIVLLGGGTELLAPPRSMPEVNGAGDRVIYAAMLYRQGAAPLILASGGRIDWYGVQGSSPAQEMQALLEFMGVPAESIRLEDRSRNTQENAEFSAVILDELGIQRILLVTSAMHMPRAVGLFENLGYEVIPAPADYTFSEPEWRGLRQGNILAGFLNFYPSVGSLNLTTKALKEYFGLFVYGLRGWL